MRNTKEHIFKNIFNSIFISDKQCRKRAFLFPTVGILFVRVCVRVFFCILRHERYSQRSFVAISSASFRSLWKNLFALIVEIDVNAPGRVEKLPCS